MNELMNTGFTKDSMSKN